jgi:diguanylate cyclase (GGDEF)-like protein
LPFAQREQLDPKFYFQLQALAGAQTYFLRVQSQSSVTVPLELLTDQAAERTRAFERLFYGLFYGALLALGMYNLLLLVSTRDRLYLFYILFATAAGVAQFAYNGLAYELLWPDAVQWNDRTPNFFGLLALALGILFTRTVLDTRATAPRLDVALRALAVTSAALGILSLGPLSYATSVRAFSTLGPICAAAMLGTGILCALRGYRVARYFLLAWSVLLLGVIVHSLRVLGIVPTHLVTVHAIQIGAGLEMLLLSFALADRINTFKREKEAAQATALETSRQYERELESKVEMRVADLAALNQALEAEIAERRKAEEMLTRMAHHDPLTGLPNRLLLRDRFAVASANARRNETGLALLLLDLDGFKQVNDTFGHDAGDRLLTNVGEALRTCVRESDTVARLGGDEFVVLAGNLGELEQEAMLVAQKIIERLSVPTLIAGNYVVVGPSIGISLFPRDGADLDTILKCADHAMYEAKQSGGKTLRFCTREMAQQYQLGLQ